MRKIRLALRIVSRSVLGTLAFFACAAPLSAQSPRVELDPELPFALEHVIRIVLDAPGATVTSGDTTIGGTQTVAGPLAHFGGSLILEGEVRGDVTAVGSEVHLRPAARIAGNLTVIGGGFYSTTMADVAGTTIWLREERVVVTEAPGRVVVDYEPPPGPGFPIEPKGFAGVVIHGYNGVDGLSFGLEAGLVERKDWPRTELSGGPVFRTERDGIGWRVGGLRELPGAGGITVGAGAYRVTTSPEAWHRGDRGNGLASLFFADDDRTYHERTGYELWVEKGFPLAAFTVRASWRDDDFESLESREPFAFFGDDEDWRENPPVDEGSGRALTARAILDRRDDPSFPIRGLWAEGRFEHWGLGGDLEFDWAQGQARAYAPIPTTAGSFVALRVMGGGRLGSGDTLAPQFLYRLGGGSTVPGYDALNPLLTGDRMAFATATLHQAVAGAKTRWYVVGLASIGDAWFADQDVEMNASFGAGIAIHGKLRYAGVFGVYGVEEEQWQLYTRLTPWF
ncbi:MAG TPA: BamA/TamA family outer membrane protein [Gemmatimonadota bacterium]|nr:BamA/TamA family outer membrane protein [Gemmatimonadota bacterium]